MLRSTRTRAIHPASLVPMSEYSIDDIARRAGAAQDYVGRLVALGVVSVGQGGGFSEGDVRRVRLMQTLEQAGLPLGEVAAAIRRGDLSLDFMDMSHFERLSSLTDITFQELSEKTSVPVELLMVIREAAGFAEPQPTDRVRENEHLIAPLIQAQVAVGFRPPVIERWLRVYGDSLRRIAETEGDWWHTEVEVPLLESGMTPAEMSRIVQRTSTSRGGRPIKWLGDGVMLYFPEPGPGVIAALDMVEGIASAGLPPAHVGLHAGPVLFQEGDYYGRTVNAASRIADYARPGEVVVSQEVVDAADATPASFVEIGPVELKGLSEALRLFTARHDTRPADS